MQRGMWAVGAKRILSKDPPFGAPGSGVGKEFEVIWIWPNSMAIQCHSFPSLGILFQLFELAVHVRHDDRSQYLVVKNPQTQTQTHLRLPDFGERDFPIQGKSLSPTCFGPAIFIMDRVKGDRVLYISGPNPTLR